MEPVVQLVAELVSVMSVLHGATKLEISRAEQLTFLDEGCSWLCKAVSLSACLNWIFELHTFRTCTSFQGMQQMLELQRFFPSQTQHLVSSMCCQLHDCLCSKLGVSLCIFWLNQLVVFLQLSCCTLYIPYMVVSGSVYH